VQSEHFFLDPVIGSMNKTLPCPKQSTMEFKKNKVLDHSFIVSGKLRKKHHPHEIDAHKLS